MCQNCTFKVKNQLKFSKKQDWKRVSGHNHELIYNFLVKNKLKKLTHLQWLSHWHKNQAIDKILSNLAQALWHLVLRLKCKLVWFKQTKLLHHYFKFKLVQRMMQFNHFQKMCKLVQVMMQSYLIIASLFSKLRRQPEFWQILTKKFKKFMGHWDVTKVL